MRALIVDDETLARSILIEHLAAVPDLEVIGQAANGFEAVKLAEEQNPDLIFLDIQMPKLSGFEVLELLGERAPAVIFTTAFDEFALRAFEVHAVDYLLKPVTFERFFKAVNKARDYHALQSNASNSPVSTTEDYFFVKCTNKFERIYFSDILYIQGMQNYVTIFTVKGKYMTHLTLKAVEDNLRSKDFIRVHKSYIVAISRIEALENNELIIHSARIPVSRNYRDAMLEVVVGRRLWKK